MEVEGWVEGWVQLLLVYTICLNSNIHSLCVEKHYNNSNVLSIIAIYLVPLNHFAISLENVVNKWPLNEIHLPFRCEDFGNIQYTIRIMTGQVY